jgi:hypothetical protein
MIFAASRQSTFISQPAVGANGYDARLKTTYVRREGSGRVLLQGRQRHAPAARRPRCSIGGPERLNVHTILGD